MRSCPPSCHLTYSTTSAPSSAMERDLRSCLARLDDEGDLLTVTRTVDRHTEAPALIRAAMDAGRAIRFESIAGSEFPVVGSLLCSHELLARSLGTPTATLHDEYAVRLAN